MTLIERGVLTRRTVGTAVVAPGEYESMDVPLLAFFPISDMADLMVDATGRDLQVTDPPTTPIGMAVVVTGDQPLGRWLWNEYLAPLIFLNDGSKYTLPVMLVNIRYASFNILDVGALQAGVVVAMIPCLVIYVALQRFYVSGLVTGALRG